MFLQIILILDFVLYLHCEDRNESFSPEPGIRVHSEEPTSLSGIHINSSTYIIVIIVFLILIAILCVVALLFGVRRGKHSARCESEAKYEKEKAKEDKTGTTITPIHKTETLKPAPETTNSLETVRSLSDDDLSSTKSLAFKPKTSPTDSQVLAFSEDTTDIPSTVENNPQWGPVVDNKDLKNNQNNSSDKQ